ncbi:LTA synthase family protein [Neobacillus vireti]|uniref:LTA synthase family protein n=1 Tax=Neobacillus vireti TaxID=220686 RepID=UPI002FFF3EA5
MKNKLMYKGQGIFNKYIGFFFLSVFLLWIKTYFVQLTQFQLGIENTLQRFLLFLNPLGSSLLFLGIGAFFKGRKKYIWTMVIYFLLSFLLYANVLFYRFFNDFITLPTLTQTQNFGDVSGSVTSLLRPYDFLFFIDFIVLLALLAFRFIKIDLIDIKRRKISVLYSLALVVSCVNLSLAELDRPQLLTRGFDRNYIVKYLGMYNYTIYDAVKSTHASAQRVMADSDDTTEVINYTKSHYAEPNPAYFGKAKGMNVIYLHLESTQNFLINYKLNGQEVTPFLNSLIKDQNTMYFDNFFHQTGQGKTSDAEFMLENSLFGLPEGSVYTTKGLNTFQAAPAILGQNGYTSAVFHGNSGSFWNRNEIYKSFGFDKFFDANYYQIKPGEEAEYGLMDKPFYQQSIPLLETIPQPFYTKFIPVANHYPYKMNQKDATIAPAATGDASVDGYFQTARYADEALRQFFDYLKKSGLYNHSVIILYGDHYGISENHNKAMAKIMGKEITPFENAGLQRVPLFIRVPGVQGGVNHEYGGQVDLLPTLLHLLGVDTKEYVQFGTDLLSKQHDSLVAFRNGDYVSPTITSVEGKYYDSTTGLKLEADKLPEAKKFKQLVQQKLSFSDKLVNGDLLRFYTPKNFTPVDRTKYDYNPTHQNKNDTVESK